MNIKKTLHLIVLPLLLVTSAALILAGALLPRHGLYYPALFILMLSGVFEILDLSISLHYKKGFAISLLNLVLLIGIALQRILEDFPVIAAQDWHLGVTIMLLYILDIGLYVYFFREQWSGPKNQIIRFITIAAFPLIATGLFYLGAKAWIGLSILVLFCTVSYIAIRNVSVIKKIA